MDCDFTHPPEAIPALLAASKDCDLVVGSRHIEENSLPGWSPLRSLLTRFTHFLTKLLLRMPYDATNSFRVYRLDCIPRGLFDQVASQGYSFFFESLYVLWSNGVSVGEVPVKLPARGQGNSKMTVADGLQSLKTLLRLSFRRLL